MKFESLKAPKFKPMTQGRMARIVGGDKTGGGSSQAGSSVWNPELECYIVPVHVWTSDSYSNGVWCYEDMRDSQVYSPVSVPRPR